MKEAADYLTSLLFYMRVYDAPGSASWLKARSTSKGKSLWARA
jgi:hypothetical protein